MKRFLTLLTLLAVAAMCTAAWAQDAAPEAPAVPDVDIYSVSADSLISDLSGLYRAASMAYNDGDYETAAKYYIELIRHDGHNDTAMYNLACCYGLLDEVALAKGMLAAAVDEGFGELWQIESDADLQSLRDDASWAEFYAGLVQQINDRQAGLGQSLWFSAPTYMRCRVMYPEGYDPQKRYKLVVGLHGFGADNAGFMALWQRFAQRDFIFALPQAPYAFNSGLPDPGFSWGWFLSGEGLPRDSWQLSEDYVVGVISQLEATLPVDQTYVLGFSQGAALSYCVGIRHRQLVDGIIVFGGWLDENYIGTSALEEAAGPGAAAETGATGLRVFIAHGNEDRMVQFSDAQKSRDRLTELGYDVTFREFDGGHRVPADVLQEAEKWMNAEPDGEETSGE